MNRVGQVDQQVAAAIDGQRHPFSMGLPRRRDRTVDIVGAGQSNVGVGPPRRRIDVGVRPTGLVGDPFAADQKPTGHTEHVRRHCASARHSSSTRCFCSPITWFRCDAFAQP